MPWEAVLKRSDRQAFRKREAHIKRNKKMGEVNMSYNSTALACLIDCHFLFMSMNSHFGIEEIRLISQIIQVLIPVYPHVLSKISILQHCAKPHPPEGG